MDKIKFSEWLKLQVLEANKKLLETIDGTVVNAAKQPVETYFESFGIKASVERLESLKTMIIALGIQIPSDLGTLSMRDFQQRVTTVPFSLIALPANPNGHTYGSSFFLAIRGQSGYKQDGTTGNAFPVYEQCAWLVASPADIEVIVPKYIELAKNPDTDFAEYVGTLKMYTSVMIDFSEIE